MAVIKDPKVISEMYDVVDINVREIMLNRRAAEIFMGISNEEYDERLNEICDKWYKRYGEMNGKEIVATMVSNLVEAGGK